MALTSWLVLVTTLFSQSVHTSIPQAALTVPSMLSVPPPPKATRMLRRDEIQAFKPYTWFAATTACNIDDIKDWKCGQKCEANPEFTPIAVGGDGNNTQFWFSGYDKNLNEVIVSHQGSNVRFPDNLSAPDVITAVKKALSLYPTKNVTVVGPSLGGAIALLDAVMLPLVLPKDVTVRYVGYGTPRVGNQAFADYVDAQGMSITRLNNRQDPIPLVPTREFFEYHHPSGEIHVTTHPDGAWVECRGQDNPDEQCSTGAVTLPTAVFSDHNREFDGVYMGEC